MPRLTLRCPRVRLKSGIAESQPTANLQSQRNMYKARWQAKHKHAHAGVVQSCSFISVTEHGMGEIVMFQPETKRGRV